MERRSDPHPPSSPAAAISSVLAADDLLREILLRLSFPTTLVRAALVSRRWLRLASDPSFLRRFSARHPPRLLGFYHTAGDDERTHDEVPGFVLLPDPPPELAVALRRRDWFRLDPGASGLDVHAILKSRNGRFLVVKSSQYGPHVSIISPMRCSAAREEPPALPFILKLPRKQGEIVHDSCISIILPEDGGDDSSFTFVEFLRDDQEMFAKIVSVEAGVLDLNNVRKSASIQIQTSMRNTTSIGSNLLVNGTLYQLGEKEHIIGLNLASMELFLIKFPDGVEQLDQMGNLELLRAGDSGFYLIHLKGFQIHVWLCTADCGDGGGDWELVDTVCLRQLFGQIAEPNWESGDDVIVLHKVEDNVEVLLQINRVISTYIS
uniref:Uncharacterized protein n=1 Tax=Leersia perrieri TaxID=77586 RepID=A0A0D9UXS3_9ORYZ